MSQFSRIILGGHSVGYPYGKQPRSRAKLIAFVLLIAALAVIFAWDAYGAGLDDCYRATCRVEMGTHSGSGCVFKADADHYYVLTNAHVAGTTKGRQARVVFNRDGYEGSIPALVEWGVLGNNTPDMAILSVLKANLDGYEVPVIPLAAKDEAAGATLLSVGAPRGGWINAWRGHLKSNDGDTLSFLPAPLPGRSGSALFSADGASIVGLVTWQTESGGGAQSVAAIRRAMGEPPMISPPDGTAPLVPVTPAQCPDGNCRPPILGGGGPWQNLPRNRPPATPPAVEPYKPTTPAAPAQPAAKGCECKPHEPCQCDQAAVSKMEEALAALVVKLSEQGVSLVDLSKRLDAINVKVEANTAIAVDLSTRIDGIKTGGNAIVRVESSPHTPGGLVLHYEDGSVTDVQLPPIRVRQIDRNGNVVVNEQGEREEMNVWLGQNMNLRYRNVDDAQVEALEDRVRDLESR